MKKEWTISWRWKDVIHAEEYEYFHEALGRQIQLEMLGMKVSIHRPPDTVEEWTGGFAKNH